MKIKDEFESARRLNDAIPILIVLGFLLLVIKVLTLGKFKGLKYGYISKDEQYYY